MNTPRRPAAGAGAGRRWVLCADDFAIDAGACDAIGNLIERGRLTATSVLVDAPLWPAAVPALAAAAGRADVGLHLNLTESFGQDPATVWPLGPLLLRARLGALPAAALRGAIERQLDAFEAGLGRAPDYVDGHQHVHQLPLVRTQLLAALARRYPRAQPWLRGTRPPAAVRDAKARFIGALGDRALRRQAAAAGFPMSACLVGVYDFAADAAGYWRHLERWFAAGPDGSVLMTHPSRGRRGGDPIGAARTIEYDALASQAFGARLEALGIAPARGSACFRAAAI